MIELAREACVSIRGHYDETGSTPQELERLVALVRADERAEHEADKTIIEYHEATIERLNKALAAQKPWVGLTNDERESIANATIRIHGQEWAYATAIEAKLKEKNHDH
jgi:hypothetical protein